MTSRTQTTRALYLVKLIEVLKQLGIDFQPVLRTPRLSLHNFDRRDREIECATYLAAVETALRLPVPADLGFLVGEHTTPLEHGVLGYALLSSADVGESLDRYVRYQHLQGPVLTVSLLRSSAQVSLRASPSGFGRPPSRKQLAYFTQEWLVGWNQWAQLSGETDSFFSEVRLAYRPGPEEIGMYQRHLGCPVRFGCEYTEGVFPAAILERELDYADTSIGALCMVQCEQLLKNLEQPHGVNAELHKQLASSPGSIPGMEEMAARLCMSARTLRRYLAREGTTYQQVVIEFRLAMARQYLRETQLPANEIASLVGYSDTTNFYRTFRHSLGMTPSQYRQME